MRAHELMPIKYLRSSSSFQPAIPTAFVSSTLYDGRISETPLRVLRLDQENEDFFEKFNLKKLKLLGEGMS